MRAICDQIYQWRHKLGGHVWQQCTLRHERIFFFSSSSSVTTNRAAAAPWGDHIRSRIVLLWCKSIEQPKRSLQVEIVTHIPHFRTKLSPRSLELWYLFPFKIFTSKAIELSPSPPPTPTPIPPLPPTPRSCRPNGEKNIQAPDLRQEGEK